MSPNECHRLIIDLDAAGSVRRMVGPVAWFLAEEMVQIADGGDERPVVSISVRSLALRLELGRDTVGSALARLRDAGLVTVEATRAAGGRFGGIRYRVQVPGLAVEGRRTRRVDPRRARSYRMRSSRAPLSRLPAHRVRSVLIPHPTR